MVQRWVFGCATNFPHTAGKVRKRNAYFQKRRICWTLQCGLHVVFILNVFHFFWQKWANSLTNQGTNETTHDRTKRKKTKHTMAPHHTTPHHTTLPHPTACYTRPDQITQFSHTNSSESSIFQVKKFPKQYETYWQTNRRQSKGTVETKWETSWKI